LVLLQAKGNKRETKKEKEWRGIQRRGSTSFLMKIEKPSLDGKKCRICGISLVMKHTLIDATFIGDSHIFAIGYIPMWTRPICIIAIGPFSRNGV
jgi:hypothetical protein